MGAGLVGGGTFAMTLMACYGRPHGSYNDTMPTPKASSSGSNTDGPASTGEPVPPVNTIAPPASVQP